MKIDGKNARAIDIRDESRRLSFDKAVQLSSPNHNLVALKSPGEAQKVREDLQQARDLLSALMTFWPDDSKFEGKINDINQRTKEINDLLEESTFEVVHSHLLGSCRGKLIITGFNIKYLPNEPKDKNDEFVKMYGDLKDIKDDKKGGFSLVFLNKHWDFKPMISGKNQSESKGIDIPSIIGKIKRVLELRQKMDQH